MVMELWAKQKFFMETGDCYEVWDSKRGLVFRGSLRTVRDESLEEYKKWLRVFSIFVSYKVGDDSHIHFWHDVWYKKGLSVTLLGFLRFSYPIGI